MPALLLSFGLLIAAGAQSYPPKLPGETKVATDRDPAFLLPTADLRDGVTVAKHVPTIDFLYYPGQTYKGNPWSVWGDGLAVGERYYSAIGDHIGPQGNAFVHAYDAKTKELKQIADMRKLLDLPDGHYTPGKIHSRIDLGSDGWLYFSTHRGSTRVTIDKYHYKGDWIVRHHPETGKTEVVAQGPVSKHCIPTSVLDPDRLIFYGGTSPGDYRDKRPISF